MGANILARGGRRAESTAGHAEPRKGAEDDPLGGARPHPAAGRVLRAERRGPAERGAAEKHEKG